MTLHTETVFICLILLAYVVLREVFHRRRKPSRKGHRNAS